MTHVQCFFVKVRAGTAYRKIWRLVNNFFARIIRFTVQKFQLFWVIFCIIVFFHWSMANFNFVISQNAKWRHAGFYIDCHRMTSFYFASFCKWIEVIEENAIVIRFFLISTACWLLSRPNWRIVSKLTTDVVTRAYWTEASNQKSKYAYRKIFFYKKALLTSPAGWLPRTGISSGTLRSVIEYGLPLPFLLYEMLF